MQEFTQQVIDAIRAIPPGKVATYGSIALRAGNPKGARQVARILHSLSGKENLPWHRVVNSKRMISLPEGYGYEEQRMLLEAEGINFTRQGSIPSDCLWV